MTEAHRFDPTILREYDIRGAVGKTLHVADASALGRAFGTMIARAGGKTVAVGYDGRTHSPDFEKALVEGMLATGLDVTRIGLGPTPMLYFATQHLKTDAGIMVTGSHNPGDQNGFKMLMARHMPVSGPVYGAAIKKLAALAEKSDYAEGKGTVKDADIRDAYVARLLQEYKSEIKPNIVWDCSNGAAGEILRRLTAKLPGTHTLLFDKIDGTFPNHEPDPSDEKNLAALKEAVLAQKADLGIAFDGDADRMIAVDGKGRALLGDQLLGIFAHDILVAHPGAPIIADVKASQALFDEIARLGGKPVMWKTGNPLIKAKMAETGAPLGGEMSGHIFFGDNHNFDDGPYAAVKLLALIGKSGKPLSAWRDQWPAAAGAPEVRFRVDEARKFAVVEEVKARLAQKGAAVNDIDGVRVTTEDGWWLLRASNTDALLVARAEGQNEAGLARLRAQLNAQLEASGLKLPAA
ncbi:MAG TPA: phosphomannomutase/phosphoglucomutase [Alphaproteobacteria bacterium]|nr:phosphomannomutase/phosphoglucomutase [Alphaproteobacteria bacterium]